jgi:copper(I)-binding protein
MHRRSLTAALRARSPLRILALLLLCTVIAAPALAHSYRAGTIQIGHFWAPAGEANIPVYGPLLQTGPNVDRLVFASSALGDSVVLEGKDGTAKEWGDGVELKPGKPVSLASFGDHLKVMGVKRMLHEGETFPLTLTFEKAGAIEIEVVVEQTPDE